MATCLTISLEQHHIMALYEIYFFWTLATRRKTPVTLSLARHLNGVHDVIQKDQARAKNSVSVSDANESGTLSPDGRRKFRCDCFFFFFFFFCISATVI